MLKKLSKDHKLEHNLKQCHRGFFWSADLAKESATEPWASFPFFGQDEVQGTFKTLSELADLETDFIFMADGRSRSAKYHLMGVTTGAETNGKHAEEIIVNYKGALTPRRVGRSRRVPLSSRNFEVISLFMAVPRTRLDIKMRDGENKPSLTDIPEKSTLFPSYTQVTPRDIRDLPKIGSATEKGQIVGTTSIAELIANLDDANVPTKHHTELPCFWQEVKTASLWSQILSDFDIELVFDLTPGSAALAAACLKRGTPYLGVTSTHEQARWLGKICDLLRLCDRVVQYTLSNFLCW